MNNNRGIQWTDSQMLEILHLHDNEGLKAAQVATRFGTSKSAILGLVHRIRTHTDRFDVTPDRNGTMPPRWWQAGLAKRPRGQR